MLTALLLTVVLAAALAGCSGSRHAEAGSAEKTADTVLTIEEEGGGNAVYYSVKELKEVGTVTRTYSGRSKSSKGKRTTVKYTGVDLRTLLDKSGCEDAETIKVSCSDGYTREYQLENLDNLYCFKGSGSEKEKVKPMIAIVKKGTRLGNNRNFDPNDGTPLRLVCGQAEYDSDESMDFNMQNWAGYVETIEVED
jgi:hypothetical protein